MANAIQGVITLVCIGGLAGILAYCVVTWVSDIRRRNQR